MTKYILLLAVITYIPSALAKSNEENYDLTKELAQCYVAHELSRNINEANTLKSFLRKLPSHNEVNQLINYSFNYQRTSELALSNAFSKYCSNATDKIEILTTSLLTPNKTIK
ncbi:hypothetical protein [Colwellia sp. MB3u-4]|uniref:hypothetical protein n=1 Tax=Colwellia sp. MB3u-4 TaxID=2759822 RepID=UPI0015F5B3AA|nr:hypothetical protein [Colwellia sp. MB3u-4]MBA6289978.1 hypothetical protein [Colwellia sp. MB3u-4]